MTKFRLIVASMLVPLLAIVACEPVEVVVGAPMIELAASSVEFERLASNVSTTLTSNRPWSATAAESWITVSPSKGEASAEPQKFEISVLPNDGFDREGTVTFTIGTIERTLNVSQKGAYGSGKDMIAYSNNFDKTIATQTYGSGSSWPYLDQFDGWKNAEGTGIAGVEYEYASISARANSSSNGSYSDYDGSGNNNLFFGSGTPSFTIKNIAVTSGRSYVLSFGSEKYLNGAASNLFDHTKFHVKVSVDGTNWTELAYAFPNGDKDGRWDIASTAFTINGSKISISFTSDLASAYRLDDVKLEMSLEQASVTVK